MTPAFVLSYRHVNALRVTTASLISVGHSYFRWALDAARELIDGRTWLILD
jgi:hypothetical protein